MILSREKENWERIPRLIICFCRWKSMVGLGERVDRDSQMIPGREAERKVRNKVITLLLLHDKRNRSLNS